MCGEQDSGRGRMFKPFLRQFFVRASDPGHVKVSFKQELIKIKQIVKQLVALQEHWIIIGPEVVVIFLLCDLTTASLVNCSESRSRLEPDSVMFIDPEPNLRRKQYK